MASCPTCGSASVPCGCEIASWIEPIPASEPASGTNSACTACGYSGEMVADDWGTRCPACGIVLPARRTAWKPRVTRLVNCPECGLEVGVTAEDEGKTVVCPGCSYFLGTPVAKPGAGRVR
jgi:uncharacterized paraquat-inducible protein A